jgi:hypothetical protein
MLWRVKHPTSASRTFVLAALDENPHSKNRSLTHLQWTSTAALRHRVLMISSFKSFLALALSMPIALASSRTVVNSALVTASVRSSSFVKFVWTGLARGVTVVRERGDTEREIRA